MFCIKVMFLRLNHKCCQLSQVCYLPCLKKKIMSLFNRCLLFISGTVLGMRDMEIDVLR